MQAHECARREPRDDVIRYRHRCHIVAAPRREMLCRACGRREGVRLALDAPAAGIVQGWEPSAFRQKATAARLALESARNRGKLCSDGIQTLTELG